MPRRQGGECRSTLARSTGAWYKSAVSWQQVELVQLNGGQGDGKGGTEDGGRARGDLGAGV